MTLLTPLSPDTLDFARLRTNLRSCDPVRCNGTVTQVIGLVIECTGPSAHIDEICEIRVSRTAPPILAEVVGFRGSKVLLMPLSDMSGIKAGGEVIGTGSAHRIPVSNALLGRVLDGLGAPIDGKGSLYTGGSILRGVNSAPPHAMHRTRITEPLHVGVRAIDGLLTLGKGQRVGIFAGSGVGKSSLLGSIARNTAADVNVICLAGERGREVREFIENDLGPEGLSRSVVVVATSDLPPLVRLKSAFVATTIAEYFRDQGKDVLLMMDSVTRLATSQREIGLAVGEPPATRGYTPSVFALLPKLLERAGAGVHGSITGLYTVLVEGDDMNEPVADSVRGILDGHIVLDRNLAARGHYPAIDIGNSLSRLMSDVCTPDQLERARTIRSILATYANAEDLINIGAYVQGSSPEIDFAKKMMPSVTRFLVQDRFEQADSASTTRMIADLSEEQS